MFTQREIWTSKEDYSTLIYFEGENPAPTETQSHKFTTKASTEEKGSTSVTKTTGGASGDK